MEEAQVQQAQWEREKQTLLQEAEQAAMKRVESWMRVQQFQAWQQEAQQAHAMEQKAGDNAIPVEQQPSTVQSAVSMQPMPSMTTTTAAADATISPAVAVTATAATTNTTASAAAHHPILGAAQVDLGYKRVHLVSAKDLSDIPVWEKQRIYRHARAQSMAKDKQKTLPLGLPGVISLYEVRVCMYLCVCACLRDTVKFCRVPRYLHLQINHLITLLTCRYFFGFNNNRMQTENCRSSTDSIASA